mgnify:CR=1 FL=1|jgi:hypothetical protein
MNTLSKLTLISVMISAMAGCSVRKDGNNLSNVTTADSLLFRDIQLKANLLFANIIEIS